MFKIKAAYICKRAAFQLASAFIVWLMLVTPASAGWPDFNDDSSVDCQDLARLANAWDSVPGSINWDPRCDIWPAVQGDGIIDEEDLKVMCDNWLAELPMDLNTPGATMQIVYKITGKFFEGVTWDPNSNKLFFTNMTNKQILRLDSAGDPGSAYVWMNDGAMANGLFLGIDGRLLSTDQTNKRVRSHKIGASGPLNTQTLCNTSDPPNDLCQLSNGNIYMTCQAGASSYQGVYLLKNDALTLVKNGLNQPNGIIASLDETKLYVSESGTFDSTNATKRWWVYPINANGTLGTGSIFFKPSNPMVSNKDPDGMTIDERGNLYLTGLGGLYIVSPTGQELRRFRILEQCNNLTFGGLDYKTLYIACQDKIYSLSMEVCGGE